jgi:hypothetical protein
LEERDQRGPGGYVCGDVGVVLRGKGGRGIEVAVDYCGSEGEEEGGCCEADA